MPWGARARELGIYHELLVPAGVLTLNFGCHFCRGAHRKLWSKETQGPPQKPANEHCGAQGGGRSFQHPQKPANEACLRTPRRVGAPSILGSPPRRKETVSCVEAADLPTSPLDLTEQGKKRIGVGHGGARSCALHCQQWGLRVVRGAPTSPRGMAGARGQDSGDVSTGPLCSHPSLAPCQCRSLEPQVKPELERGR